MYSFSGPAEVRGHYQSIRNVLQPILIALFLITPWLSLHGEPFVLFDFYHQHYILFGFTFFSHDTPLLFFLVILLILAIFIVTALFGRLWCGWTCPQTVFIHGLFNKIEKLILGNYSQRQLFFSAEDSLTKKIRILLVYVVFLILSWVLAHSLVAYFLGADVVTAYIEDGPGKHWQSFSVLMLITASLFFNFSFFREKLCFFVCPYGRFQNALIDTHSLGVFYDGARGEPRGKLTQKNTEKKGDCIDCNRCVTVCPTKIDIRKGFQLECISCAKCIDACNEVMQKIKRPLHLIRYSTSDQKPLTIKSFRLGLYAVLFLLFSGGLVWSLSQRSIIHFTVTRAHSNPFSSRFENGKKILQNQVLIHLKNQSNSEQAIRLTLSPESTLNGFNIMTPAAQMNLQPGQDIKTSAFIEINEQNYLIEKNLVRILLKTNETQTESPIRFMRID